jgi:hypothetical protein
VPRARPESLIPSHRFARTALLAAPILLGVGVRPAAAASVSVSPGSGPGGRTVSFTSSGFDLDGVGYHTGFYVDGGFAGHCPTEGARANCTIELPIPAYTPGSHSITASNSAGELAFTTYTVAAPSMVIGPACVPPGGTTAVDGLFFAVGFDAGLYLGGSLVESGNFPSATGSFSREVTIPPGTPEGEYELSAINSVGANVTRIVTVAAACQVIGTLAPDAQGFERQLPDGSWAPLAPGEPLRQNDVIRTGPDGQGRIDFLDNTEMTLSRGTTLTLDDYAYDPQTQEGRSSLSVGAGFFHLLSGLIGKKHDPENVQIQTAYGCIGIRGTQLYVAVDEVAEHIEITHMHGTISFTPRATGLTALYEAPLQLSIDADGVVALPEPGFASMSAAGCALLGVLNRLRALSRARAAARVGLRESTRRHAVRR